MLFGFAPGLSRSSLLPSHAAVRGVASFQGSTGGPFPIRDRAARFKLPSRSTARGRMSTLCSLMKTMALVAALIIFGMASALEEGGKSYHVLLASVHQLSHIKPLTAIAKELLRRGHQVTFAMPDSCLVVSDSSPSECLLSTRTWVATRLPKAQYLATGEAVSFTEKEAELAQLAERRPLRAVFKILSMISEMNEPLLSTLLKTFTTSKEGGGQQQPLPDLMVVDTLSHAAVDAAEKLGVPVVFNNPLPLWHDLLEPQGMMVPVHAFPRSMESLTTFTGRVGNFLEHCIWFAIGVHGAMLRNGMRQQYGLAKLGYTAQLTLRSSRTERDAWILQNTVFGLDTPRLMEPRVFMVGPVKLADSDGGCTGTAKDCKATLAWLNLKSRRARPVLYINVGVLHPPPFDLADSLLTSLATLADSDYDILWALDDLTHERLRNATSAQQSNLFITSSVPEVPFLAHPRVIAVVSHCTFEAISQALSQGLPVIGLPTRGNQAGLCTMAQNAGVARCLLSSLRNWVDDNELAHAVRDITTTTYKAKAEKLARVMRAAGGAEKAADIVELALAVGLDHVREGATEVPPHWFVGSMADVRLALFAMVLLLYVAGTLLIRLVRRLSRRFAKLYGQLSGEGGEEGEVVGPPGPPQMVMNGGTSGVGMREGGGSGGVGGALSSSSSLIAGQDGQHRD